MGGGISGKWEYAVGNTFWLRNLYNWEKNRQSYIFKYHTGEYVYVFMDRYLVSWVVYFWEGRGNLHNEW